MTVNLTRIYTKLGDSGETHLGDMSRVSKLDPRVEAYGTVDELNATLGVALAQPGLPARVAAWLERVQNDLLDLGADLSVPGPSGERDAGAGDAMAAQGDAGSPGGAGAGDAMTAQSGASAGTGDAESAQGGAGSPGDAESAQGGAGSPGDAGAGTGDAMAAQGDAGAGAGDAESKRIGAARAARPRLRVTAQYTEWLEGVCDEVNATLEPLRSFVIPGGNAAAAQLHVCRTVCRRAERRAIAVGVEGNPEVVRYLNRLSDMLFIIARSVNQNPAKESRPAAGTGGGEPTAPPGEPLWQPGAHTAGAARRDTE